MKISGIQLGGIVPKQCIRKINILLDPQEAIESYGAAPGLLLHMFSLSAKQI